MSVRGINGFTLAFVHLLTPRGVIDAGRRKGKGRERFLILGSASIDLLRQSGKSLAGSDWDSLTLRTNFIQTYLERDVAMFGPRIPAETLERLWIMLAHRQGSLLNASDLGRALQISTQTVTRYIDLLVDLLLVRRLTPFHANIGKRLVKSPKVYVRDPARIAILWRRVSRRSAGERWRRSFVRCPETAVRNFGRSNRRRRSNRALQKG